MDPTRIAALLEPFLDDTDGQRLTTNDLAQISTYVDLLLRWNASINLTAIREPEEIVTRHFGESFFLARHLFPHRLHAQGALAAGQRSLATVVDIGSGAGFPALPLKIWAPHIHLTLIESSHKKAAFLREVIRTLTLTDVDVIAERAEAATARTVTARLVPRSPGRDTPPSASPLADVVTLRAVEKFDQILPIALRFLAPNGRLALLIGESQVPKLELLNLTLLSHSPSLLDPPVSRSSDPDRAGRPSLDWETFSIPQSLSRVLALGILPEH